jgi:FkbM family methyltransferase
MKSAIKRALLGLGYELQRYHVSISESARFAAMLKYHRIDVVLDVGANIGQFAASLRSTFDYRGRIVSFEPMKAAYAQLCEAASADSRWEIAPRCALGGHEGEVSMNISRNSVSSSILPMLEAHKSSAPESEYTAIEKVPLRRLDAAAAPYLSQGSRILLKVDTQGYESEVLAGASDILSIATGVSLELSLVPLYEGTALMPQMVEHMKALEFDLWGLTPAFVDARSGRSLQFDAVFFRHDAT